MFGGRRWHFFLVLLFLFSLVVGLRAVDFGEHRDEPKLVNAITESIRTGLLLPRWYNYPSACYDLALLSVLPEVVPFAVGKLSDSSLHLREELIEFTNSNAFYLRVRRVFLVITLLSVVWSYLLVGLWRKTWYEAALAATLLAFSWEVAYHARWAAPDGILMQFGILTILACFVAIKGRRGKVWWIRFAAVAAGLGCGAKYPGGLLILPVVLTMRHLCATCDTDSFPRPRFEWGRLLAIFVVTFLVSTPGAVCEPLRFLGDAWFEVRHYGWRGHGAYSVVPVVQHAPLWWNYFSLAVFSHYWPIALLFFYLIFVGAYSLIKEDRPLAMIFLCVPVLYTVYFWTQKVMVVRNYLIVAPFLAVLSARGAVHLIELCPRKTIRVALACVVVAMLAVNAGWLVKTSNSVHDRHALEHGANVLTRIKQTPDNTFYLWPEVATLNPSSVWDGLPNVTGDPNKADRWLFTRDEIPRWQAMPANSWNWYDVVSGANHLNINYYPSWVTGPTVISLPPEKAKLMHVVPQDPQAGEDYPR